MPDKIVLGFIGKPGAGKDTAIGMAKTILGAVPMLQFSDPINECLKIFRKLNTRTNQQLFSTTNREAFGQDLFNDILYERALEANGDVVCIGGIRRPTDIVKLQALRGFRLIFIAASPEVRWQRIVARADRPGDAQLTWEDFLKQDGAETERLIDDLGACADHTLQNDGDMLHLSTQLVHVLDSLGLA